MDEVFRFRADDQVQMVGHRARRVTSYLRSLVLRFNQVPHCVGERDIPKRSRGLHGSEHNVERGLRMAVRVVREAD